jgi:hypothetical protein
VALKQRAPVGEQQSEQQERPRTSRDRFPGTDSGQGSSVPPRASFPIRTAAVSLISFPRKKAGMMFIGWSFAMPPATKSGVVGSNISE